MYLPKHQRDVCGRFAQFIADECY